MLIYFKICCDDIKYRLIKEKKKQNNCERTIVVGTLKQSRFFFLVLCISTLLLPKFILCCNFCVEIYFLHFNKEEKC